MSAIAGYSPGSKSSSYLEGNKPLCVVSIVEWILMGKSSSIFLAPKSLALVSDMNCRGCNHNYLKGLIGSSEYLVVQNSRLSLIYLLPGRLLVLMSTAPYWSSMLTNTASFTSLFFLQASALVLHMWIQHIIGDLLLRCFLKPVNPSRTF